MKTTSILTKKQEKKYGPVALDGGFIVATVRHDDECGNGHNSFSITAEIYEPHRQPHEPTIKMNGKTYWLNTCGCCHDEIARAFPELAPFIRWHLSSTDKPMHYEANALYWAGHCGWRDGKPNSPPNMEHLKSTIVYGALATDKDFDLEGVIHNGESVANEAKAKKLSDWLKTRLEAMQSAFRTDVEKLGLVW